MLKKGHVEEGHVNNERWLLTYADLITLLLVFFVVMYSISKADQAKFSKLNVSLQKAFNVLVLEGADKTAANGDSGPLSGTSILDDFIGFRNTVLNVAKEMGIEDRVSVVQGKEGIAVSLSGNLLFDSGRADLLPESTRILAMIAEKLAPIPNEIRVEGHTDNIPVDTDLYPTNWELSVARATVVTRYLIEMGGIEPHRLSAQGFGEHRPVADNNTRENRALNRRVEIIILYPDSVGVQGTPSAAMRNR